MFKPSKRVVLFLAVFHLVLMLALAGCGGGGGPTDPGGNEITPVVTSSQPSGTTFTDSISVTLNVTPSDALVTYTTDGSNPNANSTSYTGALTFTQSTTLKVYAAKGTSIATYNFIYTKVQSNITTANETLMQGFYWEIPSEPALWTVYAARTDELKAMGITMLWIPPATKGAGISGGSVNSNGYDVYDRYDLGEFNQKNTTRTKFGTKDQLETAITALHNSGIKVIADVVLNHMMGADAEETPTGTWNYIGRVWTSYTFPGRGNTYSSFKWNWTDFNAVDYIDGGGNFSNGVLLPGKQWNSTFAVDYLMGCNIDYDNTDVQNEMKVWGKWFTETLKLDGFRLDAIQHVKTSYAVDWLNSVRSQTGKDLWTVGEVLDGNRADLTNYLSQTNHTMKLFDFDLYYWFRNHQSAPDFSSMVSQGLINTSDGEYAVTFADNHDTSRDTSPGITTNKEFLYAYILTLDKGVPCVWWKDYYVFNMKPVLDPMLQARKSYAYGKGAVVSAAIDYYAYLREGTSTTSKDGLVLVMSRGGAKSVSVNTKHANTMYIDLMGNSSSEITTDANGIANFTTPAGKVSIWVPKN